MPASQRRLLLLRMCGDRRKPEFILSIVQFLRHALGETMRLTKTPKPDVGVQEQFHSRHASQSSRPPVGPTISPTIFILPAMLPSFLPLLFSAVEGTTSATGSPKRVTRIGFRVFRTSSRMPRHLALNSEMATSFILKSYYGQ